MWKENKMARCRTVNQHSKTQVKINVAKQQTSFKTKARDEKLHNSRDNIQITGKNEKLQTSKPHFKTYARCLSESLHKQLISHNHILMFFKPKILTILIFSFRHYSFEAT